MELTYAQALEQMHIKRNNKEIKYYNHQVSLAKTLDAEHFPHVVVVKKHRTAGFTTVALHLLLWRCLSFENQRCAYIACSSKAKSLARNELLHDIANSINHANCPTSFCQDTLIAEATNSVCHFYAPSDDICSRLDFVVIDEPAFASRDDMNRTWLDLLSRLTLEGVVLIGSVPNGTHSKSCKENWFYQTWWRPNTFHKICWGLEDTDIEQLYPEQIEHAKQTMSSFMFAQEYQGKFLVQPKNSDYVNTLDCFHIQSKFVEKTNGTFAFASE